MDVDDDEDDESECNFGAAGAADADIHRLLAPPPPSPLPPLSRPFPSSLSESESLISAIICSNAFFSSARFIFVVQVQENIIWKKRLIRHDNTAAKGYKD
jgi:hypothetical protein